MRYDRTIDDIAYLTITDDLVAQYIIDEDDSGPVQLASEEEAVKLIAEFEDDDGELCYAEDAIMEKYEAFQGLRP